MKPLGTESVMRAEDGRYACFESGGKARVVGYGRTVEQSFERAAEAMFAVATDLEKVHPLRTLPVSFIEESESRALMRWLNLIIELARRHGLAFCEFHLQREGIRWWGCASGQPLGPLAPGTLRMKGARADEALVKRDAAGCEAGCVVEYTARAGAECESC